jgi:uncharacterized protein YmfQ (DUF2313 family)
MSVSFYRKQSGSTTIDTLTTTTAQATLSNAVDLTKSFLLVTHRVDSIQVFRYLLDCWLSSSTTVDFAIFGPASAGGLVMTIEWEVIEFVGNGINVQRGRITDWSGTNNVTISSVNTTRAFPIIYWNNSGSDQSGEDTLTAEITSGTNLQIISEGSSNPAATLSWQVIDCENCSIQLISASVNSANTTQAITSVDTTKTFIVHSQRTTGAGQLDAAVIYRVTLDSATAVRYERYTSGTAWTVRTYVVTWNTPGFNKQQVLATPGGGTGTQAMAISAVNTNRAVCYPCCQIGMMLPANSTDDDYGDAGWTCEFTSTTNVNMIRSAPSVGATIGVQVLEWRGIGSSITSSRPSAIELSKKGMPGSSLSVMNPNELDQGLKGLPGNSISAVKILSTESGLKGFLGSAPIFALPSDIEIGLKGIKGEADNFNFVDSFSNSVKNTLSSVVVLSRVESIAVCVKHGKGISVLRAFCIANYVFIPQILPALDLQAYKKMVLQLFPLGGIWRNLSTTTDLFVEAFCTEINRLHLRVRDLFREINPATSEELLPDWERIALLPEEQPTPADTIAQRQLVVAAKMLTSYSGPSRQFFTDLAASMGITVIVTDGTEDETPPRVDIARVDLARLNNEGNIFEWNVDLIADPNNLFSKYQTIIERIKPAHTVIDYI